MAVALTSSVNLIFGSQVLDPETGVLLNDEVNTQLTQVRSLSSFVYIPFSDG